MDLNQLQQGTCAIPLQRTLVILFVTFLLILTAGLAGAMFGGRSEVLLSEALVIVPAWIYVARSSLDWKAVFRIRRVPAGALWISAAIGLGAALIGHELDALVEELFPMPAELERALTEMLRARSVTDGFVLVLAIVVLAGLLEEMLFRGMLLGSLEAHFDVTRAVLLSALLFAFFHLNPWTAVQILVFGVILGVLAWRGQSVFPAAIVHAVNNAFEFAVLNIGQERLRPLFLEDHVSPPFLLLAVGLLYLGFRRFYSYFEGQRRYGMDGSGDAARF
jgi:membrane protease YdiL (CAAX protease family)